jgi:hypothetical protein
VGYGELRVGNGTHMGRMLGYCPDCSLYHGSGPAREACLRLMAADEESAAEGRAWRALQVAISLEQTDPIIRAKVAALA